MAKINNAQVIQKLIDELKLYPGTDLIPTELADKILPVFQINDQAINFSPSGEVKQLRDITENSNDKTFTVPPGFVWEIMFGHVLYNARAVSSFARQMEFQILNSEDEVVYSTEAVNTQLTATTETYNLLSGSLIANETVATFHNLPIPDKMFIPEGFQLKFFDNNDRDNTDDFEYFFIVREIST